MTVPHVLVASPIDQHVEVLREFLLSLLELEETNVEVSYLFYDNNRDRNASQLLWEFYKKKADRVSIVQAQSPLAHPRWIGTQLSTEEQMAQAARMKNDLLEIARDQEVDYVLLVNPNLILHPQTISLLLETKKEIISPLFWVEWEVGAARVPQVWRETATADFTTQLQQPGIYQVDGVGGCIWISYSALAKGVHFPEMNVSQGEDLGFSQQAKTLGYSLYVDTRAPLYHIHRIHDLKGIIDYKRASRQKKGEGNEPITISLCMIVKNEESVLERCLRSVEGIVDEIIIVDTGSTDATKEIASQFTDRIIDFKWIDDFAAARNESFRHATQEYILWLDADDVLREEDRSTFLTLKNSLDRSVDSVSMAYHLYFDSHGKVNTVLRRNRLVRRSCGFHWEGVVHENLLVAGNVYHSEIAIVHKKAKQRTDRNLRIFEKQMENGSPLSARDLFFYANELRDKERYEEAVRFYQQYLQCKDGDRSNQIYACLRMAESYYLMHEREQALYYALKTLEYDLPQGEACSRIAHFFFAENRYAEAAFWYEMVTKLPQPEDSYANVEVDLWTWYPHLQLCACYERLGDLKKAKFHNDAAHSYHPDHPAIVQNKQAFERLGIQ
ncbi:glycosyltransferase [Mechercharimyces sp. CAU 1602]|uniref:glycosyltransferase n=1 Tax=Mechercharimyces sp. CAU 1602 TaxID=2973933 RepID=UPI002161FD54|nr:glycosyltransferase [Mechercharimyces sp. CAU 1602]MCS1352211.1 glycosyltransferase [Mechercharimyces sp. CAU 1602]